MRISLSVPSGRRPQIHRLNKTTKQPMGKRQSTQDSKEAEKEIEPDHEAWKLLLERMKS
jgi:hypothetical protein